MQVFDSFGAGSAIQTMTLTVSPLSPARRLMAISDFDAALDAIKTSASAAAISAVNAGIIAFVSEVTKTASIRYVARS
jgi:hypothetical protein